MALFCQTEEQEGETGMIFKISNFRIYPKQLVLCILYLTLLMNFLSDEIGLPSGIRYINDVLILLLLLSMINGGVRNRVKELNIKLIWFCIVAFTVFNILTATLNLVPLNLVIWAIRNTYRFFVFFYACVLYLRKDDIKKFLNRLYYIQWLNVAVVLYQYYVLELEQDTLGGIFGHGGNAGLLIYSVLLLSHAIFQYTAKEYPLYKLIFITVSTSLTSVLAEVRVFFILFLIIVLVNILLSKFSWKKILVFASLILLFLLSVRIYSELFPYVELTVKALLEEGLGQGGGYNISRLNAFSDINDLIIHGDVFKNLFGFGFGNCEYSDVAIFTSDFYKEYGHLNYRWFSHQWIFLETGYFGVISYLLILLSMLICAIKTWRKAHGTDKPLVENGISMCIICFVMFFYNSLLKADFAYIAFFALAIPTVMFKENIEREGWNNVSEINAQNIV